jgi:hypothetical protein
MKKRNIYFIGLLFVVMALGSPVFILAAEEASTMMCDEGTVNIGDADADVQDKCGEPNSKLVKEWVYNFGPAQSVYTVIFKEGKVVRILESK